MRQGWADTLRTSPFSLWWLAGLWLCYQLPTLPPWPLFAALVAIAGLAACFPAGRRLAVLLLAFTWAGQDAGQRLRQRLPEGPARTVTMPVEITGLPQSTPQGTRFDARILREERAGQKLRLYWYAPAPPLQPGERWLLQLRLKPVVGSFNPGGFDFEGWAFRQRLVATGSVQQGRLLGRAPRLDRLRQRLADGLGGLNAPTEGRALLRALLLGDRQALSDTQWEALAATGTGHLMAISGLHLGLLALWVFWPVRWLMARFRLPCRWLPAREWGLLATLPVTLAYALLAGFSLPTQRAWLMLAAYVLARLLRLHFSLWQVLGAAAVLLTLLNPAQILGAGFWLSFVAVAVLALASGDPGQRRWRQALHAQLAISLAMVPLGLLWFGRASLLALPVNLLLIPLVGWLLLPAGLLGLLLAVFWPEGGQWLLAATASALAGVQQGLDALASMPGMVWQAPGPAWPWLFSLAALLFWLYRRPRQRLTLAALALLLAMPVWVTGARGLAPQPVLRLWVLDVGQGLSAVLQAGGKTLVYDSGPSFRNGGSMSERVLLPFLRTQGIRQIHAYIASHADDDHAGGSAALLRNVPVAHFYSSARRRFPQATPCHRDQQWQWGALRFRFLYPRAGQPYLGNDSSCVLLVQWRDHRLLLPGDAGSTVEWVLLQKNPEIFPLDVLLPGHHGSRSASSPEFVRRARPHHAVFAAGRHNRFDFPKPEVMARYQSSHSHMHFTGGQGAVLLELWPDGHWSVAHWREKHAHLWHWPAAGLHGNPEHHTNILLQ